MATYSRLSFTNEEESKLIAFIEQHPSMWDPKNADYHNLQARSQLWLNISQQLHKNDGDCRRKWRFIRDYYLNKRKRMEAGEQNHNSKYANLDFLRKVAARRLPMQKTATEEAMSPCKLEMEEISDGEEHSPADNVDNNSNSAISECKAESTQMETTDLVSDESNMEEHLEDISDSDLDFADLNENEMPVTTTSAQLGMQSEPLDNKLDELGKKHSEVKPSSTSAMSSIAMAVPGSSTPVPIVELATSTPPHITAESTTKALVTVEAMSTQNVMTHEKVIDLFFESMAATVKTFPPHLMATAKMRVFQVISELEVQLHQVDH